MFKLIIHTEAATDLKQIKESGDLASHGIRKWIEQSAKGRRLWRIKVFSIKGLVVPYRIIYAVYPHKQIYAVLAILSRSVKYEESHPRVQQLIATYNRVATAFNS